MGSFEQFLKRSRGHFNTNQLQMSLYISEMGIARLLSGMNLTLSFCNADHESTREVCGRTNNSKMIVKYHRLSPDRHRIRSLVDQATF